MWETVNLRGGLAIYGSGEAKQGTGGKPGQAPRDFNERETSNDF
jgi:hypothetical protein